MNFKNWPYWVKGGVVGIFTVTILSLIPAGGFHGGRIWFLAPIFPLLLIGDREVVGRLFKFFNIDDIHNPILANIKIALFLLLLYFVAGAIIGWLYGKFKNHKLKNITP